MMRITCPVFLFVALLLSVTLLLPTTCFATIYYVSSSSGDDANDGQTENFPWKTLLCVSQADVKPGDRVLFRRGDEFRGQLVPRSGERFKEITYGAYGEGKKPVLLGSVGRSKPEHWTHQGGNIWCTKSLDRELDGKASFPSKPDQIRDVGNIIFNNGKKPCGFKRWSESELKQPGDFWYDRETNLVKLVCPKNPADVYDDIELAVRRHMILKNNVSHVIYEDLVLLYGGAHGIGGYGQSRIVARRLDIGFIGGGDQHGDGKQKVRFGNGIEFWGTASHCMVKDCRIWECYDAALTHQGNGGEKFRNLTYWNNTIWNCEFSFEYWNRPETAESVDVFFTDNRCYNAGGGWGHRQRPDPGGRHFCMYNSPAVNRHFHIEDNLFYNATNNAFYASQNPVERVQKLAVDENQWYQPEGEMIAIGDRRFTMDQFAEYQKTLGLDQKSTLAPADLKVPPYPTDLRPVK